MIGSRTKVKVVKNKVAPPFREAEFDILYGTGISKEGELIDIGAEQGVLEKTGAWYAFGGERIGQGRENARRFLIENPEVSAKLEERLRKELELLTPSALANQEVPTPDSDEEDGSGSTKTTRSGPREVKVAGTRRGVEARS